MTIEELAPRQIELERQDARRKALHEAAQRVEKLDGNEIYQKAWKAAATAIRSLLIVEAK